MPRFVCNALLRDAHNFVSLLFAVALNDAFHGMICDCSKIHFPDNTWYLELLFLFVFFTLADSQVHLPLFISLIT